MGAIVLRVRIKEFNNIDNEEHMKTIRITRPKEKYYNENKIQVFINDKLVGKLKQKETQEFQIHDGVNEVYAKSAFFYKSPTVKFQAEEDAEFEIKMNPAIITHPYFIVLGVLYFLPIVRLENVYIKISASLVMLALVIAAILQGRRAMKSGVLISKK